MPTSEAGSRARRTRGFTLLELLIVIAIIALATAGVGLALRDSSEVTLDREAERLAALLESARAQSRASGMVVRWRPTPQGPGNFSFDGLPVDTLPTHWLAGDITAQPMLGDRTAVPLLLLGPDPIIAAQRVRLTSASLPGRDRVVGTDGLRPFAVVVGE
jgi:general secretion pathway protein H